MAKKVYEEENIRAIADKIREITGGDSTYKTAEMPSGIEEVYEAGIIDHNKMLWESMAYDSQWFYTFAGHYWNDTTFNPTVDLVVPYCSGLFYQSHITDLKGILERNGVKLDFSKATRLNGIFEQSTITNVGIIDTRKCTNLQNFLYSSSKLVSIEKVILKEDGSQTWANIAFRGLASLENITFEGVIGSDITFNNSPLLTHESLMSIINALTDYSNKTMLRFSDTDYTVSGYDIDPRGSTFDVHYAEIVDGSLECECSIDGMYGIKITVYDVDISEADLPYISNVEFDVISIDSDDVPIVDVVITVDKTVMSKTLTIGSANIAKLTEAEKKKVTAKGWWLK